MPDTTLSTVWNIRGSTNAEMTGQCQTECSGSLSLQSDVAASYSFLFGTVRDYRIGLWYYGSVFCAVLQRDNLRQKLKLCILLEWIRLQYYQTEEQQQNQRYEHQTNYSIVHVAIYKTINNVIQIDNRRIFMHYLHWWSWFVCCHAPGVQFSTIPILLVTGTTPCPCTGRWSFYLFSASLPQVMNLKWLTCERIINFALTHSKYAQVKMTKLQNSICLSIWQTRYQCDSEKKKNTRKNSMHVTRCDVFITSLKKRARKRENDVNRKYRKRCLKLQWICHLLKLIHRKTSIILH